MEFRFIMYEKGRGGVTMNVLFKKLAFQLRWLTMSERQRYAYLWVRTEEHLK